MSALDIEYFEHDGLRLAYRQDGEGDPILLIHGFASSSLVNWVSPGWFRTLTEAGYRVIAIDNRGHGLSAKPHDADEYTPTKMAADAAALLDHLGIEKAHVMGYSMGARISAFLALEHPERVHSAVFGGLGIGMVTGAGAGGSRLERRCLPKTRRRSCIRVARCSANSPTRPGATVSPLQPA